MGKMGGEKRERPASDADLEGQGSAWTGQREACALCSFFRLRKDSNRRRRSLLLLRPQSLAELKLRRTSPAVGGRSRQGSHVKARLVAVAPGEERRAAGGGSCWLSSPHRFRHCCCRRSRRRRPSRCRPPCRRRSCRIHAAAPPRRRRRACGRHRRDAREEHRSGKTSGMREKSREKSFRLFSLPFDRSRKEKEEEK